ncbi:sporulation integral membrane protein YtvI [Planomicrobium sp. CPCC 101079]|uniref:sporulation integral membrane protein YtvI n=1 Tax=Planomicrobium sp. CPCC 101079 TaxID=2599618 RepID=UPI0011B3B417|nr:sporulation integral membrane protein YtvI [Planomicrobium sp. CPCC 101079]TWT01895.1 sporulation integral membrane protein YtvI [Planomicrobium sp. CPCC 101079]
MANILSKRTIVIILWAAFFAVMGLIVLPASVPLIFAFLTALILEPAVRLLHQKKFFSNRKLAVLTVFVLFTFILGLSVYFIVAILVGEVARFIENIPYYITEINTIWVGFENNLFGKADNLPESILVELSLYVQNFFDTIKLKLTEVFSLEKIGTYLKNIPNLLVSLIVYLIALFLFLLDLPRITEKFFGLMTANTAAKFQLMTLKMKQVFVGFLKAQFYVSIYIFAVALIGLLIISPEIALVMAIIIWIIDLIPLIGSIIILAPWSLYYFVAGDTFFGVQLAILGVILLVVRRVMEPKVMGTHIGLSPLATLIAMFLGLKLFGFLGVILGPVLIILFNSLKDAGIIRLNFKV